MLVPVDAVNKDIRPDRATSRAIKLDADLAWGTIEIVWDGIGQVDPCARGEGCHRGGVPLVGGIDDKHFCGHADGIAGDIDVCTNCLSCLRIRSQCRGLRGDRWIIVIADGTDGHLQGVFAVHAGGGTVV